MKSRDVLKIAVCIIPLALIFILPRFEVTSNALFLLLLVLCCGSHLFMLRGFQGKAEKEKVKEKKENRS